jgi:toxin ParE1/3/4
MRIAFLGSTKSDLRWFRRYYEEVFPQGAARARAHYRLAKRLLRDNPQSGRPTGQPGMRELLIARTPFSFVYRLKAGTIEIVRVLDLRGDPPDVWSNG